eukprot:7516910-Alexandrium_andersonii.AAC.1
MTGHWPTHGPVLAGSRSCAALRFRACAFNVLAPSKGLVTWTHHLSTNLCARPCQTLPALKQS